MIIIIIKDHFLIANNYLPPDAQTSAQVESQPTHLQRLLLGTFLSHLHW